MERDDAPKETSIVHSTWPDGAYAFRFTLTEKDADEMSSDARWKMTDGIGLICEALGEEVEGPKPPNPYWSTEWVEENDA